MYNRRTMSLMTNSRTQKNHLLSAGAVVLLGCAVWLAYGRAIEAPFILDDPPSVTDNPSIVRLWPLIGDDSQRGPLNPPKDLPTSGRPLVNLTFALNYHFGKLNPVGYHVFNLVVHLLSAVLVWLIITWILQLDYFEGRFIKASQLLAFLTALLWAVHPLNTETVVYVTQRTELMMGLFYLATLYASLRYWASATSTQRRIWLVLAALACLSGMACKEVMVTAPVVVLLLERTLIAGSFRQALRRSWPLYAGLAVGWLLMSALNYDHPRAGSAGFGLTVSAISWWLTQAKILWIYLKLVVWPWPLLIHYQIPYLETFGQAWPWLLPTELLIGGVLVLLWRRSVVGLAGAWMLLILSPTLIVPIITEVAAERRMYLPLAALVTLAVAGSYWLILQAEKTGWLASSSSKKSKKRRAGNVAAISGVAAAAVILAVVWSMIDVHRVAAFHDPITFWQDTVDHEPDDSFAYNNLGTELIHAAQPQKAIKPLQQALRLDPKHFEARINLGTALMQVGRLPEAIGEFQQVVQHYPSSVRGLCDLGIALGKVGRVQEAIDQFQAASKVDPNNIAVHYNLGLVLARAGKMPDAIEQFRAALYADPNYFEAHVNLGAALASTGQPQEALEHFQQALQIKPEDCGAYFNLALAYDELGRTSNALASAQKALELARSQKQESVVQKIESWLLDYRGNPTNR
jgi:tetratricopeptide (TPR) repeat protein